MGVKRVITPETRAQIIADAATLPAKEIALRHGVSLPSVYNVLRSAGVRTPSRRGRLLDGRRDGATQQYLRAWIKRHDVTVAKTALMLRMEQRMLEAWVYEREVPLPYQGMLALALRQIERTLYLCRYKRKNKRNHRNGIEG